MAKKLIKKSKNTVSKKIPVIDEKGNRHILKATVISVSPTQIKKFQSNEILETEHEQLRLGSKIVAPPLSLSELAVLSEFSTELGQTIEQMEIGIDGFGGRLKSRKMTESQMAANKSKMAEEKAFLDGLLTYPNPEDSFVKLRRKSRKDREQTGNAWWELIPSFTNAKRYSCINHISAATVLISKPDKELTRMSLFFVRDDLKLVRRSFMRRFRRYVQVVGTKKVYFKEFGDTRIIDLRNGDVANKRLNKKFHANELFHFKIPTTRRTPYGMPRFTGNIISIKGSRQTDETNILTMMNNHVPSMAILANGGMLTSGSVQRLREFVDSQVKGNSNYSKFLLIEAESSHDGLSNPSNVKIEIKPLTQAQHSDQLWQKYDSNNADKLRRSFRVPPLMVGRVENLNRSIAQESERFAEKYVYNPEREDFDTAFNKIMMQQGIRFWTFKSNSPNVTNDEDIVRILVGGEKTGGLSPRIARELLSDVLNQDLPEVDENIPEEFKKFFHPDIPFSLSLAMLMHSAGNANANGTFAPQGQIPKAPNAEQQKVLKKLFKNPNTLIKNLMDIQHILELELDKEGFGSDRSDYFK